MPRSVPELWRQQGEILADYARRYEAKQDVAVELPTGTGKTMVGLLIGDWRRRKYRRPVLYACPTQQLVHQVCAVSKREGVPAVTLLGSHTRWSPVDQSRYDGGEALGITTYSAIFNAAPKVGEPGTIVFDDAHAAEQYVAEAWSVSVNRFQHEKAYPALLKALRPGLGGMFYQRMEDTSADIRSRLDVRLVVPLRRSRMAEAIDGALGLLEERTSAWWSWNSVRPGLASCLVYISWREILIRPFIPPTSENEPFTGANQRLYLSATLGRAGELERAFGRSKIARLPLPDGRSPRSGRRYFVFADLADGDTNQLATEVTTAAGKALVLATSTDAAKKAADGLNVNGWPILGKDDIEKSLDAFATKDHAILALAGRYDGIDLPDDACRLVCLEGLPDWAHLQERFLGSSLRAKIALEERTRTRVVQGAGRATRNPSDHAIVLIRGGDLTRYLTSPVIGKRLTQISRRKSTSASPIAERWQTGPYWRTSASFWSRAILGVTTPSHTSARLAGRSSVPIRLAARSWPLRRLTRLMPACVPSGATSWERGRRPSRRRRHCPATSLSGRTEPSGYTWLPCGPLQHLVQMPMPARPVQDC